MAGPLDGLRVLEFGRMVAAPYCARLLADLGAECLKVERPEGDPIRHYGPFPRAAHQRDPDWSGLHRYVNANKGGCTLDPATAAGREALLRLIGAADVFVTDLQPAEARTLGLEYERLMAAFPDLIAVSVTPFGAIGPHADDRGGELVEWAAGAYANLTPAGGQREGGRPLKTAGFQAGFMTGAAAAAGTMAALFWRDQSGGRGQWVDVSTVETLLVANDSTFAHYLTHGENVPTRLVQSTFQFLPCKDGAISVLFVREDQWERMVEMMGSPEWAASGVFGGWADRRANWDAISALMSEWLADYTPEQLYRMAQARRIPLAPVNDATALLTSPHLRERGYLVDLPLPDGTSVKAPGPPYRFAKTPWSLRRGAPALGSAEAFAPRAMRERPASEPRTYSPGPRALPGPPLPLAGVRVLDFSWVWAGPQCCRLLADLGAEVIKIESDKRVDNYRTANSPAGPPYGYNKAVGYNTLNRNKLGIRLNLGIAEGRDLVLRLAATADLVVENFAPRVMPGWGLSWDDFARVNPAITMLSMSAMGATGPDRDYVLYGNSQVALAGIGAATGFRGGPPENVGLAHGDPIAAFHGAFAAVAAVYHARRTGEGQHIDMSQWEAVAATYPEGLIELGLNGVEPERRGNADEWLAPHGYYRCADRADEGAPAAGESDTRPVTLTDAWIAIAVESDAQWRALCAVLDRPAWRDDPRFATAEGRRAHAAELDGLIEQATMGRDAAALARDLQAAGVAAAKVTTIADVVRDEQLLARGFFQYIDHPEAGRGRYFGTPWKLSASPARLYRHAPLFGGDTAHVITDLLGLPADEVARLDAAGVFY